MIAAAGGSVPHEPMPGSIRCMVSNGPRVRPEISGISNRSAIQPVFENMIQSIAGLI